MKSIIFDLDGVIVFTDMYHYAAWKKLADSKGIYFDETINNRLRGVSRMESLEIVLEKYEGSPLSGEEKAALAAEKNDCYRKLLSGMKPDDVSKEVRDTLALLKKRGHRLAIGSSSKNAREILDRVGLIDFFDAISDGNNISQSKPHPEVFLKAAEYLGVCPGSCVVVEDAYAGIDAAKEAGMTAIAVGDAASYEKADYVLEMFSDLAEIKMNY
ncbi:MAG: beta-phosphoglucomutase [Oscillospiraceae bacterium]|nr:beta-phosphoglucomutase [Oscillospiraceae bacterium]